MTEELKESSKQCERSEQQSMHPLPLELRSEHRTRSPRPVEQEQELKPSPLIESAEFRESEAQLCCRQLFYPTRNTFGIIDQQTGLLFPDLISYSIEKDTFSALQLIQFYYFNRGTKYLLQMDRKLTRKLKNWS